MTTITPLRMLPYEEQVDLVADALASLVQTGAGEKVAKSYPYEPGVFADAWPALTVEDSGFVRTPEASNNRRLPNVLTFTVRAYYPIVDGGKGDGYRTAQEKARGAMGAFLDAVAESSRLTPEVRVISTDIVAGRTLPVQDRQLLRCYEATINIRIH